MSTNYQTSSKLLQGEYLYTFEKIEMYILSENLPYYVFFEMLEEIVDLLLSAQYDQTPIQDVIGSDIKSFCEQIIRNYHPTFLHRFLNTMLWARFYFFIQGYLIGLASVAMTMELGFSAWTETTETSPYILPSIIISLFLLVYDYLMKKYIYHQKWYTKQMNSVISWIAIIITICFISFIYTKFNYLIYVPNFILVPSSFIIYYILHYYAKKNRKNSFFYICFYDAAIHSYRKCHKKYLKKCQKKHTEPKELKEWMKNYNLKKIFTFLIGMFMISLFISVSIYFKENLYQAICFFIISSLAICPLLSFYFNIFSIDKDVIRFMENLQSNIYDDTLFKSHQS